MPRRMFQNLTELYFMWKMKIIPSENGVVRTSFELIVYEIILLFYKSPTVNIELFHNELNRAGMVIWYSKPLYVFQPIC